MTKRNHPAAPATSATPDETPRLTHLDETGKATMVDVGHKASTQRTAIAQGRVRLGPQAFALLSAGNNAKGEVLGTARIAGVLAAKRCAELIPLCHSLPLSFVGIDFDTDPDARTITVIATCRTDYKTGVEMEAMTACSVAALTIYDMCKAADKGIVIEQVRLCYKSGGKSGEWHAAPETAG
ncbi:cyclic pyranopterin monophosphate synthase MoaC [Pusillimonas sp. TS35]|uniref:cyclic pyranopterin monophosphate synthase MoaC n=1 Tax=Paracandidimonas lactea TaxID=2895524 RepID=UPI00136E5234|nr:cyclic pyranopterin monophosphate synthase MoaC [Paracandidimonas lactea]MYN14913.1 cyclic pyranopterin monophosphate synthase MoaC [Pusillimonas sp. TS35]